MNTKIILEHPRHSLSTINTNNINALDIQSPDFHKIANWISGESLVEWWHRYCPNDEGSDKTFQLYELIKMLDNTTDAIDYREGLFIIYLASNKWLADENNATATHYQLILALRNNVKLRYQKICEDLLKKANELIQYANTNIAHYTQDVASLRERIQLLRENISNNSIEVLVKRLKNLKKPLKLLQRMKEENEKLILEINHKRLYM